MSKYCVRCGRKLWYQQIKAKQYDPKSGNRIDKTMDKWFCWVGVLLGRGNPYGVQHDNYVTGDWKVRVNHEQ